MEEVKKTKMNRKAKAAFEMKHEELEKALMAVGTLLLVAGLKHVLASLLEKWRALAFFFLNLLLLSIFFMSLRSDDSGNLSKDTHRIQTVSKPKKQRRKRRCHCSVLEVEKELQHSSSCTRSSSTSVREASIDDDDGGDDGDAGPCLSKEELNAKVEAFITTFRQQLALDAKGMVGRRYYASSQGGNSYSYLISN
ncbi:uncharacterized protein LOC122075272 [Macadamia integrifolia]|uniref:uncharacterized protein LOC122075272 n=1 Tax=Macadamia integrifolia TaxID=60698 RepID=UPI001C4FD7D1|nr:uncharacterized protein LOC122075272 [Macadamia integrifolia]